MTEYRGSQMHVLDWTGTPEFEAELFELLKPLACTHDPRGIGMPHGVKAPQEARLESFGPRAFPERADDFRALKKWWLEHRGNTPNWDIALRANIEGAPGLILVEAKANHPELDNGPKQAFAQPRQQKQLSQSDQDGSRQRSDENGTQIRAALEEATRALAEQFPTIALGCEGDYQLSNRVAFAWKIAKLGIPVVLVYLGFTGDDAFRDQFRDDADWRNAFIAHLKTIGSPDFLERRIETGAAPMWVLMRSRQARRISPPVKLRTRTTYG